MHTGLLLINLGTPDSPSAGDVRKYLREFLSDPLVIDIPPLPRWLLVNLIIAPFRATKSARLYRKIWTNEGSPLLVHGEQLKKSVQKKLGTDYVVELAMRYQRPSIASALKKMQALPLREIIVLPLFPQYATASTGSVIEEVNRVAQKQNIKTPLRVIRDFYNHPAFINAEIAVADAYRIHEYDHLLFSFHGLPERQILKADTSGCCLKENCCDRISGKNTSCYRAQCYETARLMASRLGIRPDGYTVCFQSRLGRAEWIKPYTTSVMLNLAEAGKKNLLVFAPAFVADCLETLHEIGTEYDALFREAGGEKIQLVESLNAHPAWVEAIAAILSEN